MPLLLACILILSAPSLLFSQVNTEKLRQLIKEELGTQHTANIHYGFASGNSNHATLKLKVRSDHRKTKHHFFVSGDIHTGHSDGENYVNRGFVHLRWTHLLSKHWHTETYAQQEFNDFIDLDSRTLLGAGLRYTPSLESKKIQLTAGTGLMIEQENHTQTANETLVRSSSYLTGHLKVGLGTLSGTTYIQPAVREFSDYRILTEANLETPLTRRISLTVTLQARYDNQPPSNLRRYDIELLNGLKVRL